VCQRNLLIDKLNQELDVLSLIDKLNQELDVLSVSE